MDGTCGQRAAGGGATCDAGGGSRALHRRWFFGSSASVQGMALEGLGGSAHEGLMLRAALLWVLPRQGSKGHHLMFSAAAAPAGDNAALL